MLVNKILPKRKVKETIPEDLRKYLEKDVYELILKKDEAAMIESDDLLQCDYACGGLIDKEAGVYLVAYYPKDYDKKGGVWDLRLKVDEIAEIVFKKRTSLDLWACEDKDCSERSYSSDFFCMKHDRYEDGKEPENLISWERIRQIREAKEAEIKKMFDDDAGKDEL